MFPSHDDMFVSLLIMLIIFHAFIGVITLTGAVLRMLSMVAFNKKAKDGLAAGFRWSHESALI